jgi:hypothetical protein
MATEDYYIDSGGLVRAQRRTFYQEWIREQGVPNYEGYFVEDLDSLPLGNWPRKGGRGCFINLVGSEERSDLYLCEIAPGQSLKPQKQLFEEMVYILDDSGAKRTFEWQEGSLFSPPLNAWHQHFNGQGDKPTRYLAMTMAPSVLNLFRDNRFIFDNNWVFEKRFNGETDYFSGKEETLGRDDPYAAYGSVEDFLQGKNPVSTNTLKTNFVRDVHQVELALNPGTGEGFRSMHLCLANNAVICHIADFDVAKYKKAHRHCGMAHVIMLSGKGYTLMWLEGKEKMRIPWKKGTIIVPPAGWFHQHFPTSKDPARYLALRGGTASFYKITLSKSKGGDCIDYEEEEPEIRQMYEAELAKEGLKCEMPEFDSMGKGLA